MMHRSIAQVLEHFDLPPIDDLPEEIEEQVPVKPIGYLSAEEVARKVEDACARTRAECEAKAQSVLTAALEDQTSKFEERLVSARQEWTEVQAERLMSQFVSMSEVLEAKISASAARVLRPFILENVRAQTLAELRAAIEKIMTTTEHPAIEVNGPADLLDALADAMSGSRLAISYHPDSGCDIRAIAGDTVIETQIQHWAACLDAADGSEP